MAIGMSDEKASDIRVGLAAMRSVKMRGPLDERKVAVLRYTKDNRDYLAYVPVVITKKQSLRYVRDMVIRHVHDRLNASPTWIAWVDDVKRGNEVIF